MFTRHMFSHVLVLTILATFALSQSLASDVPAHSSTVTQEDDWPDGWEEVAPQTVARSELAAAVLDGKIYAVGGFGISQFSPLGPNIFEVYNPETDKWTELASLVGEGRHHLSLAAFDGKLYVFGGSFITPSPDLDNRASYVYDPATAGWSQIADMPRRRTAAVAVPLDEHIYIVGGYGDRAQFAGLLRYHPASDTWQQLADHDPVRDHLAAVAFDDEIWAIGGRDIGQIDYASTSIYDPATDTWREGPELNVGRAGFGATVIDGKIYVAGGELLAGCLSFPCGDVTQAVEVYDPAVGAWEILTETPIPLHGNPVVSIGSDLYVVGGSTEAADIENPGRVFRYDVSAAQDE